MHLPHDLARVAELVGRWITSPTGYVAALLLPTLLLAAADWLVRRRRA